MVRCFWWSCLVFRWSLAGWFCFCPCVLGGWPTPRPPGRGPSLVVVVPSPGRALTRGGYGCPYCLVASRRRRRRFLLAGPGWHVVRVWVAPGGAFLPCEGGHLPVPPLITRLRPSPWTCATHVRGLLCFTEWFLGRSGSLPLGGRRPSWCVPHTVGMVALAVPRLGPSGARRRRFFFWCRPVWAGRLGSPCSCSGSIVGYAFGMRRPLGPTDRRWVSREVSVTAAHFLVPSLGTSTLGAHFFCHHHPSCPAWRSAGCVCAHPSGPSRRTLVRVSDATDSRARGVGRGS